MQIRPFFVARLTRYCHIFIMYICNVNWFNSLIFVKYKEYISISRRREILKSNIQYLVRNNALFFSIANNIIAISVIIDCICTIISLYITRFSWITKTRFSENLA